MRVLNYIGTLGLESCVVVYFRVDEQRCFFAHINAFLSRQCKDETDREILTDGEGEAVKRATRRKLEVEAEDESWNLDSELALRSIFIVCPRPDNGKISIGPYRKLTGW